MKTAGKFTIGALVVILGYDLWLFYTGGTENTISYWIYEMSYQYPFIPFLLGYVMGHLTWQMRKPSGEVSRLKRDLALAKGALTQISKHNPVHADDHQLAKNTLFMIDSISADK